MSHLTPRDRRHHHLHGVTFHSFAAGRNGCHEHRGLARGLPRTPRHCAQHDCGGDPASSPAPWTSKVGDGVHPRVGDAVLVPAGTRFRVSNNGDDPAQAWVTTTLGMNAVLGDGDQRVAPPWAQ